MALLGRHITILGGGIGGLAAALAMRARGADVSILEQADAIREVGAGIQVSPNGLRVIEALGLADRFALASVRAQAVSLRDYAQGRDITSLDLGLLPKGQDYRFVHRADLIDLLADAARASGVQIRLLQQATEVRPGTRPQVTLATGCCIETELVVGADGLHSVVRPALNGKAEPFFTGQVAWRAIVPNVVGHPAEARVHMAPGRHLVSYPLRDESCVNLVAVEERDVWTAEGWSQTGDADELRATFGDFGGDCAALLKAVEHPGVWGLFRHPVAPVWHAQGVALLGDAAHPTLPFLAQGANMALEDAWVLTACLDQDDDPFAALKRYQALRRDRVVRVIKTANGNARKYHLRNPLVRSIAHAGLSVLGRAAPVRMLRQFDWLYGHDVTAS